MFEMGGNDNDEIVLKKPLDYEAKTKYILNITAVDTAQETAIAIVTINITDVNDNAPVFQKSTYQITVVDNTPVGKTVCTVTATDGDGTSPNSKIASYAITGGNTGTDFAVSTTGVITTAKALNHSRTPNYVLTLKATDGGTTARTGTTTVNVTFGDNAACTGGSDGDGDGNGGVGSCVVNILCLLLHLAAALSFNM
ncbi:neural-cadherin-like [Mercenaria mercenaria]|uniref:neural-cadherin-like n=1 Tax=Mercenaria mercenaria TaxID=6596 RepID=UPI00234F5706|nr:neural-cadherin-like [Mercenaria mercenaria]